MATNNGVCTDIRLERNEKRKSFVIEVPEIAPELSSSGKTFLVAKATLRPGHGVQVGETEVRGTICLTIKNADYGK